jgi:DNA-binding transcriptional ArsR family regulator
MSQFLQDINAFRMNLHAVNFDQTKNLLLLFRSLEHDLRKRIINLLGENKLTVTEMFLKLKIEQSVASQHLSILKEVGIVRAERVGKNIFYSLIEGRLKEINELSLIINDGLAPKNLMKHKTETVNNLFASLVQESKLDLSTLILRAFSHDFRLKLIDFILSQPNSSVYTIYSSLGL